MCVSHHCSGFHTTPRSPDTSAQEHEGTHETFWNSIKILIIMVCLSFTITISYLYT